jgi:hypothetical protein
LVSEPHDILTSISGVSFEEAWEGRVEADFIRRPLYVIRREALLKNKRSSKRAKDLRDVALLEEHAPGTVKKRTRRPR